MADLNQQLEELAQNLERFNALVRQNNTSLDDMDRDLKRTQSQRTRDLETAAKKTVDMFDGVADAAKSGASAMLQGQKGAAAFNQSINGMAKAATAAGAALTLLAPGPLKLFMGAVTALVGPITALAKASADMADQLYKGYAGLAKAGAAASDGMTGLRDNARSLGLSMEELGDFVSIVSENSKDLALFAGSAFEGRKRLAEMGKQLESNREGFIKMGLSMTEVTDGMASYLRLQTRVGQSQLMTTEQLAQGARKYLYEQDLLTKLTGMSRKEQEAAREAALSEQRFAAKLEELRQQGRHKEAEELMKTNLFLMSQSKQAAQGFRDIQTGNLQTEEAQKLMRSTQGQAMETSQRLQSGQINFLKASEEIIQGIGRTGKELGPVLGQVGTFDEFFVNLGDSLKLAGLEGRDLSKAFEVIEEEFRKQGAKSGKSEDTMLEKQGKLIKTQIDANQAILDLVENGIGPTQTALQAFTEVIIHGTKALDDLLSMVGLGRPKAARPEDQKALDENTKALEKLEPAVENAKEEYKNAFKDASVLQKMGIGRTEEQKRAAEKLEAVGRDKLALQRRQGTLESGTSGIGVGDMEFGGAMEGTVVPEAPPPTPAAAPSISTEEQLRKSGLTIKDGDVQQPGEKIQRNLIDLAKAIQSSVPGFNYFSGFNDRFHQESRPESLHTRGRAADFTLTREPSAKEGQRLVQELQRMGASFAKDEYNNPSAGATGGHIHVEVPAMAKGGITEGISIAGEAGPEAVVPLPDGKTIPVDLSDSIAKIIASNQESRRAMHSEMMDMFPELLKSSADVHSAFMRQKFTDNQAIMDAAFQRTMDYFVPRVAGLDVYSGFQAGGLTLGSRRSAVEGGQYDPQTGLIPEASVDGAMRFLDALLGYAKMDMGIATVELDRIEGKMGEWLSTIRMPDGNGNYLEMVQPIEIAGQGISDVAKQLEAMMDDLPKMADGGVTNGASIAGEAGPEAVIPLSGRTIPVEMQGMSDMISKLGRMIELQSENNRVMAQMYNNTLN